MVGLRVATIVEGHGEVAAIRKLLERIWYELLVREQPIDVLQPIRQSRDKLVQNKDHALDKATDLAARKLRQAEASVPSASKLVLIVLDSDEDPPCILGPRLQAIAAHSRADVHVACVLAHVEYETWFVAAAASLAEFLDLSKDATLPNDPERSRQGKAWIQKRFRRAKYSESVDQVKLTSALDLKECRRKSRSFDKLCRELERLPVSDGLHEG